MVNRIDKREKRVDMGATLAQKKVEVKSQRIEQVKKAIRQGNPDAGTTSQIQQIVSRDPEKVKEIMDLLAKYGNALRAA